MNNLFNLSYEQNPEDDRSYLMNFGQPKSAADLGGEMQSYKLAQNVPQMENRAAKVAGLTAGAAAAPFLATPAGAGVMIGSQLVMQGMAQKAASERAKRQQEAEIAMNKGTQEQQALRSMIENLRGSLR